ncbi:MAG: outer membrane beta-barrel protein [Hyphomonadaceae bacterium]
MKLGLKHLLLTSAVAGVLAPFASAQDNPFIRGRHVAVTERGQPEFDPEPMRTSGFDIISSLGLSGELNDNVYAQFTNEVDDTIIRARTQVEARSTWSVHALRAGASVDHREYSSESSETTRDYNIFADGRLDATRNFQLTGNASAGQLTDPRYEPASQGAPEPAQNRYIGAEVGATFRSDRLALLGQAGTRDNNYKYFYSQRNATENFVSGRLSYAISPDIAVFGDVRQTDYEYEQDAAIRNSTLTNLRVGVNFELSAPFRGEISAGQVTDNRDLAGLDDVQSFSLDALLRWFPTQLTTVTFRGFAGITDPGIPESLSANTDRYSVRVDHELLRNVLLFGEVGIGSYDFNASPSFPVFQRNDEFTDVLVGAAYKLNKHAHIEVGYQMHSSETTGAPSIAGDLDQNIFNIGLKLFP